MKQIVISIFLFFRKIFSGFLIGLIKVYQYTLSPFIGRNCRFMPSCSNYGIEALRKHGAIKGSILAIYRILRCNPWGGSGYDPVPEKFTLKREKKGEF